MFRICAFFYIWGYFIGHQVILPPSVAFYHFVFPFLFLLARSPIIKKILSLNLPVMPPTPPCHMVHTALLQYLPPTRYPYPGTRLINTLHQSTIRLSSMCRQAWHQTLYVLWPGHVEKMIWLSGDSQASGGGQLTSNLMCVMITTEAITKPYQSLPYPMLTMRNRLVD